MVRGLAAVLATLLGGDRGGVNGGGRGAAAVLGAAGGDADLRAARGAGALGAAWGCGVTRAMRGGEVVVVGRVAPRARRGAGMRGGDSGAAEAVFLRTPE